MRRWNEDGEGEWTWFWGWEWDWIGVWIYSKERLFGERTLFGGTYREGRRGTASDWGENEEASRKRPTLKYSYIVEHHLYLCCNSACLKEFKESLFLLNIIGKQSGSSNDKQTQHTISCI